MNSKDNQGPVQGLTMINLMKYIFLENLKKKILQILRKLKVKRFFMFPRSLWQVLGLIWKNFCVKLQLKNIIQNCVA